MGLIKQDGGWTCGLLLRTANAIIEGGLKNKDEVIEIIINGDIKKIPRIGVKSIVELCEWLGLENKLITYEKLWEKMKDDAYITQEFRILKKPKKIKIVIELGLFVYWDCGDPYHRHQDKYIASKCIRIQANNKIEKIGIK